MHEEELELNPGSLARCYFRLYAFQGLRLKYTFQEYFEFFQYQ